MQSRIHLANKSSGLRCVQGGEESSIGEKYIICFSLVEEENNFSEKFTEVSVYVPCRSLACIGRYPKVGLRRIGFKPSSASRGREWTPLFCFISLGLDVLRTTETDQVTLECSESSSIYLCLTRVFSSLFRTVVGLKMIVSFTSRWWLIFASYFSRISPCSALFLFNWLRWNPKARRPGRRWSSMTSKAQSAWHSYLASLGGLPFLPGDLWGSFSCIFLPFVILYKVTVACGPYLWLARKFCCFGK